VLVLVDTTVWIDFFHGAATWQVDRFEELLRNGEVALGDLIVSELLQGIRSDRDFEHFKRRLSAFPIFSMAGLERAIKSAENYRRLRSLGYTVRKTMDCLIATFCIESGLSLLHNDRDFDIFEKELGLACVHN
jgi:predicted nucleic acid-binding protein